MKLGWSRLDKIDMDCEKVNKFKSICMKHVVNNAYKSILCYEGDIPSLN